jgi:hypothetical protein
MQRVRSAIRLPVRHTAGASLGAEMMEPMEMGFSTFRVGWVWIRGSGNPNSDFSKKKQQQQRT